MLKTFILSEADAVVVHLCVVCRGSDGGEWSVCVKTSVNESLILHKTKRMHEGW